MNHHRRNFISIFLPCSLLGTLSTHAATTVTSGDTKDEVLETVVVTASAPTWDPLKTIINTRDAAQPIPAQDGADLLKVVPGFSVARKGGTGGEPILRGQAGSRLGLLLNGQTVFGGCPYRMDPPTAYIFPNAFDHVTVIKGPQSVIHGPGNSAGVVLFEKDGKRLESTGTSGEASATIGSFHRNDQTISVTTGTTEFFARAGFNRTQSDDYKDGDGSRVHSAYDRWNANAAIGWTPDDNTILEISGALSKGEAAYAGKSMDASQLDYRNLGAFFQKKGLSDLLSKIETRLGYNEADHVMDDFRLRDPGMMAMGEARVGQAVWSGNILTELTPSDSTTITTGIDFREARHQNYESKRWTTDGTTGGVGIFTELRHEITSEDRVIAGIRADRWSAKDERESIWAGGMMMGSYMPNPTADQRRTETMPSGFIRYERDLNAIPATTYIGIGYTERSPDYWELFPNQSTNSLSSFLTDPEKTTQLDAGLNYEEGPLTAWASVFFNRVDDYILYESNFAKGMDSTTVSRNVDAWSWGGETGIGYEFLTNWQVDASISYVWGKNITDDRALAQQPPLEGKLGLTYSSDNWSVGGLLRLAASQDRFAVNQGTIAGQDLGSTPGFAVFSLNAAWKINRQATLTAGVDNLFDTTYAESVNNAGANVTGYPTTMRVNEPGRVYWMKLSLEF